MCHLSKIFLFHTEAVASQASGPMPGGSIRAIKENCSKHVGGCTEIKTNATTL
ncbi:hypothetical protein EXN66_Car009226 [Channa argus]|uniref:Uncharacterized protein n=1 Tax=Channa argus TaxID=215402 RepID=A0A6G1PTC1_CHAAH|nr:hypothetical protein EXN66_Car009226 [Channa argus]